MKINHASKGIRKYFSIANLLMLLGMTCCCESRAAVITYLNVDFENGYSAGSLGGQSGGVMSGNWTVSPEANGNVETTIAIGSKAISTSRSAGGATIQAPLAAGGIYFPGESTIYLSLDLYRPDDTASAAFTLLNTASFATTGLGLFIDKGASPTVQVITAGPSIASNLVNTSFVMSNATWYRFEFEANVTALTLNLYASTVNPNGSTNGRQTVSSNLSWTYWNSIVHNFEIIPQNSIGVGASPFYVDNLLLQSGVTFPVVPEPSTFLLSGLGLFTIMILRKKDIKGLRARKTNRSSIL